MSEQELEKTKHASWVKEADLQTIREKSDNLMTDIKEKSLPSVISTIDGLSKSSSEKIANLNGGMEKSIRDLVHDLDGESVIANQMLDLRENMDKLNPNALSNSFLLKIAPKVIKRHIIKNFIHQYVPMRDHVNKIFEGLQAGLDDILMLNVTMQHQYDDLEEAMKGVQADIYLCEDTLERVMEFQKSVDTSDQREVNKVEQAKSQLSRKIRDLRTKELAVNQFFLTIEQAFNNNQLTIEQIKSALDIGPMIMDNAIRIQSGLATQQKVKVALQEFAKGMNNMMAENARQTKEISESMVDLYNNPMLALDTMKNSFDNLISSIETTQNAMVNSTDIALNAATELKKMNTELAPTIDSLRDHRENEGQLKEIQDVSEADPKNLENKGEE